MTDVDPHATRRDLVPNIPAELLEAGFDNVEEIGRGGFGVVYRCVQPSLDRAVAVKVLSTDLDRDNLERFLREQRAMGRLSGHPHIVTVLQVGVLAGGRPFIVMPYHAKNSLDADSPARAAGLARDAVDRRQARGSAGSRASRRHPAP